MLNSWFCVRRVGEGRLPEQGVRFGPIARDVLIVAVLTAIGGVAVGLAADKQTVVPALRVGRGRFKRLARVCRVCHRRMSRQGQSLASLGIRRGWRLALWIAQRRDRNDLARSVVVQRAFRRTHHGSRWGLSFAFKRQ